MSDNSRIASNSIILFVRLVVTTVISVLASRIVLDALGASDYGLYNVVGGIVTLLNVFNTAMLSTTYTYIAKELGKGEGGNLNRVFNVSFEIHAIFALLIILLGCTVGEWYISNYLNVAAGKLPDARFVFYFSLATTAISTLLVPFQGLITAYEKFNVLAIRDIITKIIFFIAIVLLLYKGQNRLRLYAVIQFGYIFLYNGSFYVYCRSRFNTFSKLTWIKDLELLKQMISFALWTLFGAVSSIAKSQGSALLINFFFGTVVNAAYAVATQVESFVQMFARSLNQAAVPQITKNYSGGKKNRSLTLTCYISKYTYILMLFAAFPVLLEMDFLLGLWLKEVPEGASVFCKLMILGGLLSSLGEGIPALVNATGNIKYYQIIYHTFNLLGLPVAWLFYKLGYNQYSILLIYCVVYFLSAILRLVLLKRLYNIDVNQIIKISYLKIIIISIPLIIVYILYNPSEFTIIGHVAGFVTSEIVVLASVSTLGLNDRERGLIKSLITSKVLHK